MIDTSKAKWEFSDNEKAAIEWFNENGFSGTLDKQYISKTKFTITKDNVTDQFELLSSYDLDIKSYMEQYDKSFEQLKELKKLREAIK